MMIVLIRKNNIVLINNNNIIIIMIFFLKHGMFLVMSLNKAYKYLIGKTEQKHKLVIHLLLSLFWTNHILCISFECFSINKSTHFRIFPGIFFLNITLKLYFVKFCQSNIFVNHIAIVLNINIRTVNVHYDNK